MTRSAKSSWFLHADEYRASVGWSRLLVGVPLAALSGWRVFLVPQSSAWWLAGLLAGLAFTVWGVVHFVRRESTLVEAIGDVVCVRTTGRHRKIEKVYRLSEHAGFVRVAWWVPSGHSGQDTFYEVGLLRQDGTIVSLASAANSRDELDGVWQRCLRLAASTRTPTLDHEPLVTQGLFGSRRYRECLEALQASKSADG